MRNIYIYIYDRNLHTLRSQLRVVYERDRARVEEEKTKYSL